MSKFKRWVRRWLFEEEVEKPSVSVREQEFDESQSLRFTVTPARGGIIVTVRHWDRRSDETKYTNHVMHDDENVSENIAQLVSMELLRSN